MGVYNKVLKLGVQAAAVNNISLSQSKGAAGNFLLNGSTAGILNYATQIRLVFAGDESGHNFTITGTSADGQSISEVIAGTTAGTVTSVNYYLTVTKIAVDAATTSTLTVGTNAVGVSQTYIVDKFINPAVISVGVAVTGTINFDVQVSVDDLSPAWDVANSAVTWQSAGAAFASKAANLFSSIQGPITMLRVLQNSGTGSIVATINTPFPSN